MSKGTGIFTVLAALYFLGASPDGLPANKAHAQGPKAPNYAAKIEAQNKAQVGAAVEAREAHRGKYLAGKRPKIKSEVNPQGVIPPPRNPHPKPAAKPDMASGGNPRYTAVTSMDKLVDLMEQSEEFQEQWDLIERNTEKFNKASVDQLLEIPGQYKLVLKDGKLDLDNSYALVFYKEGISTFKRPNKKLKVKIDGKLMDYKQDGHMGNYYFVPEFKDLVNLLEIVTGRPISENDALKLYQSSRRKGEQICSVGNIKFLYNSNNDRYDMVDDAFESLTLAEIVCRCDTRDCGGVDHLAPGSQVIVDESGNVMYRHILLDPADENHPVQVFDPVNGEMQDVYDVIAMVPLRQLLGDTGVYSGERRGDDQDAARTAKIERDPDTQDVNRKIDLKKEEDEVEGVESGDGKTGGQGEISDVVKPKDGEDDTNMFVGVGGSVYHSNAIENQTTGLVSVTLGGKVSDNVYLAGTVGYGPGGTKTMEDTDRRLPNPNDPNQITTKLDQKDSIDYHVLTAALGVIGKITENLNLGAYVGVDMILKNKDSSREISLLYQNGDLASAPRSESDSSTDVDVMPKLKLVVNYEITDFLRVYGTVSGATDFAKKNTKYGIEAGAGLEFHFEW
jgi:hypothetical protein